MSQRERASPIPTDEVVGTEARRSRPTSGSRSGGVRLVDLGPERGGLSTRVPTRIAAALGETLERVLARRLQGAVLRMVPRETTRVGLASGTTVGHPLHPLLTDVVIGAWSCTLVLDRLGGRLEERAADRLLLLGTIASAPTVVTGLSDWADTRGEARSIGLTHAAANACAIACNLLSLRDRRSGDRDRAKRLTGLGALFAAGGGWLGGHLSFSLGVGVNETAFSPRLDEWVDLAPVDRPVEGGTARAMVGDVPLVLIRHEGKLHALHDTCSHRGCSLADGALEGEALVCPCHGSAFRLNGSVARGPATAPQPLFHLRQVDGRLQARSA